MVASTVSNRSIEDICKAASGPVWFQLYVDDDRKVAQGLIERAEAAGCKALCITVDIPLVYARNREEHIRAEAPMLPFPNLGTEAHPGGSGGRSRRRFNWNDIAWIQSFAKTPVILKGILNPDDADEAVKRGVAGIVVSNHGGRVLDTEPATIEVLPAVVDRVAGRVPVLFDSGIRRGTDVLKGLGYGASAVLIGRALPLWAERGRGGGSARCRQHSPVRTGGRYGDDGTHSPGRDRSLDFLEVTRLQFLVVVVGNAFVRRFVRLR